jgi:hypothetical protein
MDDQRDRLSDRGRYVELLLVRPGVGAWWLSAADASPADLSPPSNGLTVVAIDAMAPVAGGPEAPEEVRAGDVLVRVAPRSMEYYAVQIDS